MMGVFANGLTGPLAHRPRATRRGLRDTNSCLNFGAVLYDWFSVLHNYRTAEALSRINPYFSIQTMESEQTESEEDDRVLSLIIVSRIGPAQYFQTNSDGEVVRDSNGVFQRISSNLADAEYEYGEDGRVRDSWEQRFESVLREQQFVPTTLTVESASGYVNLDSMVDENAPSYGAFAEREPMQDRSTDTVVQAFLNRSLDTDRLEDVVGVGVRMLDNAIEQNEYPVDEIRGQVLANRKIDVGLMGFAELLSQLGIEYGSEETEVVARDVMRRINTMATQYSHELAKVRGPYSEWDDSKWATPKEHSEWFESQTDKHPSEVDGDGYLMRNEAVTKDY